MFTSTLFVCTWSDNDILKKDKELQIIKKKNNPEKSLCPKVKKLLYLF